MRQLEHTAACSKLELQEDAAVGDGATQAHTICGQRISVAIIVRRHEATRNCLGVGGGAYIKICPPVGSSSIGSTQGGRVHRDLSQRVCAILSISFSLCLPPSLPRFRPPSRPHPLRLPLHSSSPTSAGAASLFAYCSLPLPPRSHTTSQPRLDLSAFVGGLLGGNSARRRFLSFLPARCLCHSSPTSKS